MHFDGANLECGAGARVVLQALDGVTHTFSYKIKFLNMNNMVKYEALTLGLIKSIEMKVATLQVRGDSKLVINQVRYLYVVNHPQLKNYRDQVWLLLENFQAFLIGYIPWEENQLEDSLASIASWIVIGVPNTPSGFPIEKITHPTVLDNIDH